MQPAHHLPIAGGAQGHRGILGFSALTAHGHGQAIKARVGIGQHGKKAVRRPGVAMEKQRAGVRPLALGGAHEIALHAHAVHAGEV